MSHASNTPRTFFGARNEESALFSMTSALVAHTSGSAAILNSDSSGYLDVAELSQKPSAPSRSTASAASTLIGAPAPAPELAGTQIKGFAHAVIGVLALGLASLTAHLSWDNMPQQPPPAATMPAIAATPDTEIDYDTRAVPEDPTPEQDLTDEDDETEIVVEEPTKKPARRARTKRKATSKSKATSKPKTAATPKPAPKPEPKPKSSKPDVMSVECLLNPDSCRTPESPRPSRASLPPRSCPRS